MKNFDDSQYRSIGHQWEEYALHRLREKHAADGPTEFVSVPATHKGDLGIDAFTRSTGIVYQFYAAENYSNARDLYERQSQKITTDLAKLLNPSKAQEVQALLGPDIEIKKWILVVPQHRSRLLIQHCNKKAGELTSEENRPSFISNRLVVHVWTEADLNANCPGEITSEKALLSTKLQSSWSYAVYSSDLWPEQTSTHQRLAAASIADLCWAWTEEYGDDELTNPWRDNKLPIRSAEHMSTLGRAIGAFGQEEVALLLVAPCLRQALLACAEREAWRKISPKQLDAQLETNDALRRQYDNLLVQRPQLKRKALKLINNGDQGECVIWWLVHQTLLRIPEIWRSGSDSLPEDFVRDLDAPQGEFPRFESLDQLMQLARAVALDPEDVLCDRSNYPREVTPQNCSYPVRFGLLAALLSITGRQSFDPLLMSEVLINHVGLSMPITPERVISHTQTARWLDKSDEATIVLDAICDHAAIDKAMAEEVTKLTRFRQQCILAYSSNPKGLAPIKNLPVFRDDDLRPKNHGRPNVSYIRPHVSFSIAQDEVRELLMGERLYGNPSLAIRELYQNALDACRYRKTRLQYQALLENEDPEELGWEGKIKFVQGIDPARGPYIECHDNGKGMRHSDLLHCFAKAGRRLADSEEYLEERAQWRQQGLNHYPNSQFGIGVFSYFMLADEIEITTRHFEQDCRLSDDTFIVVISGAGSLFHIRKSDTSLSGGGTIVRLYLSREHFTDSKGKKHRVSALSTLRTQLWVAEYVTYVRENGEEEKWEPGTLKPCFQIQAGHRNSTPSTIPVVDDVWWVEEDLHNNANNYNGRLLVDGIATDERIPAAIFNLKGKIKPQLTVDRRRVLSWPQTTLMNYLEEFGARALIKSPFANYAAFLFCAQHYPVPIQNFLNELRDSLPLNWKTLYGSALYDVSTVGIFPPDEELDRLRKEDAVWDLPESWSMILQQWPRKLLAYRLSLLTASGSWPRPIREWVWRNKVEYDGPPLGPIHSNTTKGQYGPTHQLSLLNPLKISSTFNISTDEALSRIEHVTSLGINFAETYSVEEANEQRLKIAYSGLNFKDLKIHWDIIGKHTEITNVDLELFSEEKNFPCSTVSPWRVVAVRASAVVTLDRLVKTLQTWEKRGIRVEWNKLALDAPLSSQDQEVFASPFSLTPSVQAASHSLIVRLVSQIITSGVDKTQSAIDRANELGLPLPTSASNILGELDELDRSIITQTNGRMHILGPQIIHPIANGEIDISSARQRLEKYQRLGLQIQHDDLSEITDQEDARAIQALYPQLIFTRFNLLECIDNGIHIDCLKRALEWGRKNYVPKVPDINMDEVVNIHLDDIDHSILRRVYGYNLEIDHDMISLAIVKFSIGKQNLKERLAKYHAFGLNVGDVDDFSQTYAFLDAERSKAGATYFPDT
ncbi:hypothetical protein L6172_03290 [Thalassospiraceae bacterium SW-3-3]|nr:hypothetical protein L6172_03290 [Thalassospiraceae bacterium SW-3-3]